MESKTTHFVSIVKRMSPLCIWSNDLKKSDLITKMPSLSRQLASVKIFIKESPFRDRSYNKNFEFLLLLLLITIKPSLKFQFCVTLV